jgi:hypothetical protein
MTNKGLRLDAFLLPFGHEIREHESNLDDHHEWLMLLNCTNSTRYPLAVLVVRIHGDHFQKSSVSDNLKIMSPGIDGKSPLSRSWRAVIYVNHDDVSEPEISLSHYVSIDFLSAVSQGFSADPIVAFPSNRQCGAKPFLESGVVQLDWVYDNCLGFQLLGKETTKKSEVAEKFIVDHSILPQSFGIDVVAINDGLIDQWPSWEERESCRQGFDRLSIQLHSVDLSWLPRETKAIIGSRNTLSKLPSILKGACLGHT